MTLRINRWVARVAVPVVLVAPMIVIGAPAASAQVGFTVTTTLGESVPVGRSTGGAIFIANASTSPDDAQNATVTSIDLVLGCGTFAVTAAGDCPTADAQLGDLPVGTQATGQSTAGNMGCVGVDFAVAPVDAATGEVSLTPDAPINLTPTGATSSCEIVFTYSVAKVPSIDADGALAGVQTALVAHVDGTVGSDTGAATGVNEVTVTKSTPTLTPSADSTGTVGSPITDSVTLAGAVTPLSTLGFDVYGPNDAACSTSDQHSSLNIRANGTFAAHFTPQAPGTYRWAEVFGGDANNGSTSSACTDTGQSTVVTKTAPELSDRTPATTTVGGAITDSASLTNGFDAAGNVTFDLWGPGDVTCTGAPVFTTSAAVSGGTMAVSPSYQPLAVGVYRWTSSYAGDANNGAASSACGASGSTVTVTKQHATVKLARSKATLTVGKEKSERLAVTVTAASGSPPTGTVTVVAGHKTLCTIKLAKGKGSCRLAKKKLKAGHYKVVAKYAGDANHLAANSAKKRIKVNR